MWRAVLLIWCSTISFASACPQLCNCFIDKENFKTANCSTTALFSPERITDIDVLNLHLPFRTTSTYRIKLSAQMFKNFRTVKFLNISNITIKHIPNDVFYGLNNVIEIDLSYNKIKRLNGVVFKDLRDLNSLILRGNPLEFTSFDVIISSTLQELDMGLCGLRSIPPGTFSKVQKLKRLHLDGNLLQTLNYDSVPSGLRYLNLAQNKIVNVPLEVLQSLRSLVRIDLSGNPINCTCKLLVLQDWISGHGSAFENDPTCAEPLHFSGQKLSKINERELCKMEIMNEEHISNSIKHFRNPNSFRKHYMIRDYQADQQYSLNEDSSSASEVLYSNNETKSYGTHMETKRNTEVDDSFTADEFPPIESDGSATKEDKIGSNELHEPSKDLAKQDSIPDIQMNVMDVDNYESFETKEIKERESGILHSTKLDETLSKHNTDSVNAGSDDDEHDGEGESVGNSEDLLAEPTSRISATTGISDQGHSSIPEEKSNLEVNLNNIETTSDDIDLESDSVTNDESSETHLFGSPDVTLSSLSSLVKQDDFFNTHATESPDYSYDAQHSDYNTVDVITSSYSFFNSARTATPNHSSTHSVDVESDIYEGSGEEAVTDDIGHIPLIEEQENETTTENYSFEPVNETFTLDSSKETSSVASTDSEMSTDSTEISIGSSSTEMSATESSIITGYFSSSSESNIESSSPGPGTPITFLSSPDERSSTEAPPEETSPLSEVEVIVSSESSTEIFTSPEPEAEVVSKIMSADEKENLLKSTNEGFSEKGEENSFILEHLHSGAVYLILALAGALIVALIVITLCRRKKAPTKVRLPNDVEANPGTEMQDMLLPKPPENGIKVLPKNYTNGNATNGKALENKEEQTPVLSEEPEQHAWDDKPDPIEAVTARLGVLARPQTPVFIHKSIN